MSSSNNHNLQNHQGYSPNEVMLHYPTPSRDDSLNLNGYAVPDSRHPRLETSPQNSHQQQRRLSHASAIPISPYPDFEIAYQNKSHSQRQSYPSSIDGRIDSPQDPRTFVGQRGQAPFSDRSGGPASVTSVQGHRPSFGSVVQGSHHNRRSSMDNSEATSPTSSRGFGQRVSDENILRVDDVGTDEGNGRDSREKADNEKRPPWSELKTKAGKDRKRLPLACIACRRKKIRCSGEKPACKHCLRSRTPCVYKVTTRKAAPRTDYMAMLDKRLKRMEERVIKLIPKSEMGDASAIERANVRPSTSAQSVKAGSGKKRIAGEAFGTELEEWAHARTSNSGLGSSQNSKGLESDENKLLTEGAENLPSKQIQEHLSEVFFDCVYGQSYLLLHKPSFMRRLRAGTVPPVLVLAVCAVSARFSTHPQVNSEPAFLRGESWASPARNIALRRYDEPSITILTVLLILGLHEFGTCQGGRSWMLGGMAMRMAYALQLHRELNHDPCAKQNSELSSTDREIRRRTMWACFVMDRFNSSGTERPTCSNEETVKVQLPIKESHFQMEIPGPTENLDGEVSNLAAPDTGQLSDSKKNMGVASYMIRLIALWGRVVKYLNMGGKDNDAYPIWDPKSQFTELKGQVEKFRASLPASIQYSKANLQNHAAEKMASQFLFLHVSYNQVVLFLNRFAIPTSPGGKPPNNMPHTFLSEAGPVAIDAANQISTLLDEGSDHQLVAPFNGYCAFMSSTVHVWGIFSRNPQLESSSKRNLARNVKYLSKMKKHWGMFHFMNENIKEIYRQHADVTLKGPRIGGVISQTAEIFQYGDWFNKYPHGVSETDYQDPAVEIKKESGNDAVLSQKSDLQSVEQFFSNTSPRSLVSHPRKAPKKNGKGTFNVDQPSQSLELDVKMEHQMFNPIPGLSMEEQQIIGPSSFPHHSQQGVFNSNQEAFPRSYVPDLLSINSNNQGLLPQLDRQFVYSAYADSDLTASTSSALGGITNSSGAMWDHQVDFSQIGSGGFSDMSTSAWFMPFNLAPPDIAGDGDFGGSMGYVTDLGIPGSVGDTQIQGINPGVDEADGMSGMSGHLNR